MKKGLLSVLLVVLAISGCTTVEEHSFPSNLMGIIFDNYNNPVDGAGISLENGTTLTSDIDGRFLIPNLDKGQYTLTVSKDGYEINSIDINFFDPKQVLYMKLFSLSYFKEQTEDCIKMKDWERAEKMIKRAFSINDKDPVLLYLAAIYSYNVEDYTKAAEYIETLKELGYSTDAVKNLEIEIEKKKSSEINVE